MSEVQKTRHVTSAYAIGNGIDLGSGGDGITPRAIQFDVAPLMPHGLVHWSSKDAIWNLPFKDEVLDYVSCAHVIEDYKDWMPLLREWARVLKRGGYLILQVPDRVRFRAAVEAGQPDNLAHCHESYVGELTEHINQIGGFNIIVEQFSPDGGDYNILGIFQKT
jgi:predicted SAM-dependent methyltransferase